MPRSCLLLGATGMVGGHLLRLLVGDPTYTSVTAFVRRPGGPGAAGGGARVTEVVVDFDRPETFGAHVRVDDVFCCLGTTIKKAGSEAAFRKVDVDYPLAVARAALAAGAGRFLIVTAVGADARSRVFYNRCKGEVDAALSTMPFPRGVVLLHPSMLLGERGESRPAERFGVALMAATRPLFFGGLARYKGIEGTRVARAMWNGARGDEAGPRVFEGASLFELADRE